MDEAKLIRKTAYRPSGSNGTFFYAKVSAVDAVPSCLIPQLL
jgi:hypothetical protein